MARITCTHRPPCPGCPRLGDRGPAPASLAALGDFARERGIEPEAPVIGPGLGFRTRARLAVRGRARSPKVGIFQEGSHQIVDIPRCRVHHPQVNRVAVSLREAIRATGTPPYVERGHHGQVRYLQVSVADDERVQVVVVGRGEEPSALLPLLGALRASLGDELQGLFWNGQPAADNRILGPHWQKIAGEDALLEVHEGTRVFYPPGAFRQSHGELAARLGARLREWLPARSRVVEYFAGAGALGLPLAARGAQVRFNERESESLRGLEMGIAALDAAARSRTRVLAGPAEAHLEALGSVDTAILDPPRRGVGPELVAALRAAPVERIVYVSCGLSSFLEEATALCAAGGYRLARLAPFDFFPYADHLETLALFERSV